MISPHSRFDLIIRGAAGLEHAPGFIDVHTHYDIRHSGAPSGQVIRGG